MRKKTVFTFLFFVCCCVGAAQQKPNIVLVLTDDMGVGDVGCYGGRLTATPNIDRMASEGIRFTQYYSASPICSPSRAGLLTGSHPARWNITSYLQTRKGNAECGQADFLTIRAPSVARELKRAGYRTAHFGKWHMGGGRDVTAAPPITEYGFDEFSSTWESPQPDPLLTSTDWIWAKSDSIKRWNRTQYFVEKTLAFLAKNKGQPCFVNLWPDDVHTPWVADESDLAQHPKGSEERRSLEGVLKTYDEQIGRLLEGLKRLGLDKNTLVVFTSDNGALPTFGTRSGRYRGSKLSLYEGGIRMPFIVRYPQKIKTASVDSLSVLSATDLLPTFCQLAGVKLSANVMLDGLDKTEVLLGKPSAAKRILYWEYGRNQTAFKYPEGNDRSPNLAVRDGNWKLIINADGSGAELYNLSADPSEKNNVAARHSAVTESLKKKVLDWYRLLPKLKA